ncbi:MAG: DNA polymerase IV [Spirochaetales bacterium]|nr:DNA polymerase IV [Spirochaetales bacterium]
MISIIFHIDLDAFYASVEQHDNPLLKGKPVIVGAIPGTRGVVSACSYEARKYGIHSAMPISQAYRQCPQGVFLPVRMSRYMRISEVIMNIAKEYSPEFQQVSIDEAYLDMTGTERLFGPPEDVALTIKKNIRNKTGLTLSIGIAPNKYLAKLASEHKKPDGLYRIMDGEEEAFLDRLSLKDLWGVGKKTLERLSELNIRTVRELRLYPLHILNSMLGQAMGEFLYNAVRGKSSGIHTMTPRSHSISNEITFETDRKDSEGLQRVIFELCNQVMHRLLQEKSRSKTACIKLRYFNFHTINAQQTVRHWISSTEELFRLTKSLFESRWDGYSPIRLIGIGLSNVVKTDYHTQAELFDDNDYKKKKVEEAVFKIKSQMGGTKITRASLMNKKDTRKETEIE